MIWMLCCFFFSSRRRHTRCSRDWSSDVCSSDLCRSHVAAHKAGEEGEEQGTAETIALTISGDIEREDLAGKARIEVAPPPAIAKALDLSGGCDADHHVAGMARDVARPDPLAIVFRKPDEEPVGQHAGIGRLPTFDVDAGDRRRIDHDRWPHPVHCTPSPR